MDIPELLLEHYLKWQVVEGKRKTAKQFADFIGIGEKSFNLVFNGKRPPTEEQTYLMASVLNDDRFYEISGHGRPKDPLRIYLDRNWKKLDEAEKMKIAELINRYTSAPIPQDCNEEGSVEGECNPPGQ